jgi:hypothetical protein
MSNCAQLHSHFGPKGTPKHPRITGLSLRQEQVENVMRGHAIIVLSLLAWLVNVGDAEAKLNILVDKATQRMLVIQDGYIRYMWPVSTGRDNMQTPNGIYTPQRLERNWFSSAYYDSPMPFSIFFYHGYAIHGSYAIDRLGGPASHGCVRLHPHHAAILFDLVQQEGPERTTIEVTDEGRPPEPPVAGRDIMPPREIAADREIVPPQDIPPPRGVMAPAPRMAGYGDLPDMPPALRNNPSVIARGFPPPPRLGPPPRRMLADAKASANGPRNPNGADEAGAANGIPRAANESSDARPRIKAVEGPRVAEASRPPAAPPASQPATSASSFKLLPASCWSGGASRWQWWASTPGNSCR